MSVFYIVRKFPSWTFLKFSSPIKLGLLWLQKYSYLGWNSRQVMPWGRQCHQTCLPKELPPLFIPVAGHYLSLNIVWPFRMFFVKRLLSFCHLIVPMIASLICSLALLQLGGQSTISSFLKFKSCLTHPRKSTNRIHSKVQFSLWCQLLLCGEK